MIPAVAVNESLALRGVHRFRHSAMATIVEIYCADIRREYAQQAAIRAFEIADQLELALSRFVEGSDISRINTLTAGARVQVGIAAMDCLQIARWAHEATGGAFDVSIGTGIECLELISDEHEVRAHAEGIRLDLGGIGKGYAVDRMAASLQEWEVHRALIHAGYSSVMAMNPPPNISGWPLTLSDPAAHSILARIFANGQALSGSGISMKDHIIDPITKQPVRSRQAAWVCGLQSILGTMSSESGGVPDVTQGASPAAVADALSTAFMILSEIKIQEFCSRYPGLEVWTLEEDPFMPGMTSFRHFQSAEL